MNLITPRQAYEKTKNHPDAILIDVRTPKEFLENHAVGANNVPLSEVNCDTIKKIASGASGAPIMILCQSGTRAKTAFKQLDKVCQQNVYCVDGGTLAWEAHGLPVEKKQKTNTISMERQVRIVAGFLVVAGVALAHFTNPAFIFLSGLVGCGLIFAGITDTCGMAAFLSKMPWNK